MNNENIFGGTGQQPEPQVFPQSMAQPQPQMQSPQTVTEASAPVAPETPAEPQVAVAAPMEQQTAQIEIPPQVSNPFVTASVPPVAALDGAQPVATGVVSEEPPKKRNRILGMTLGAGIALMAIIGLSLGYFLWYQNPDKIVADAMAKMLLASSIKMSGTAEMKMSGEYAFIEKAEIVIGEEADMKSGKMDVTLKMKIKEIGQIEIGASSVVVGIDEIYVRFSGVMGVVEKALVGEYGDYLSDDMNETIKEIVGMVDERWIKISYSELLEGNDEMLEQISCYKGVLDKVVNDRKYQKEIAGKYAENPFVIIREELGMQDGNYGFEVSANAKAAYRFTKSLRDTSLYEEMGKCDESMTDWLDEDDDEEWLEDMPEDVIEEMPKDTKVKFVVWVGALGHDLKTMEVDVSYESKSYYSDVSDKYKYHQDLRFVFNEPVDASAPSGAVSIKKLMEELSEKINELMYGSMTTIYEVSAAGRDTQRKDDVGRMVSGYYEYLSNNRGRYPEPTPGGVVCFGAWNPNYDACGLDPYFELADGTGYIVMKNIDYFNDPVKATEDIMVLVEFAKCGEDGNIALPVPGTSVSARDIAVFVRLEESGADGSMYYCQEG